CGQGTHSPLTF
nr:immunoglobulin light chain junction region [Macaca mulatta]MOX23881.1 immunoglobulin light chain junction region [Macaca mulatta]MOX24887.1 immunoglobulin light chain junction region [Macaca mulatta]MOX26233.1 immunoglobulin light chain junction region [Macaca mulatta]MOX26810.1 immunoglobulin light chain junction region [Macaca mulatta]